MREIAGDRRRPVSESNKDPCSQPRPGPAWARQAAPADRRKKPGSGAAVRGQKLERGGGRAGVWAVGAAITGLGLMVDKQ